MESYRFGAIDGPILTALPFLPEPDGATPMNDDQIERIRESFRVLAPRGGEVFARFVERLGAGAPALRAVFPKQARSQEFVAPCGMIVKNLHRLAAIEFVLTDIGAKNQRRGILPQHYGVARDAMIETLREAVGAEWTEELAGDWAEAINVATSLMIRGAGRARSKAA